MSDGNTLPRLLWRNAAQWPNRPAWRHKRLGIWQTQSWSTFATRTKEIALGLAAHGFGAGDCLIVLGDNRPELYAALLAAQELGGVGVPLDSYAEQERLAAALVDVRPKVAIADTVDQAERLRLLNGAITPAPRVICIDAAGMHRTGAWMEHSLDALADAGRERAQCGLDAVAPARGAPQDLALLLYPNEEGRPLAVSHAQLLAAAEAICAEDPVRPSDEALCYLPMSSYGDALYSLTLGLLGGFACNCPEAPDSVPRDLREIGPTILFAPPAACAAFADLITAKAEALTGVKRRSFRFFQRLALRAETFREHEQPIPLGLALGCRIGEFMAYAPLRDQLGVSRARWVHTGAPVPAETARLLRALGVALRPATEPVVAPIPASAREPRETQHA